MLPAVIDQDFIIYAFILGAEIPVYLHTKPKKLNIL